MRMTVDELIKRLERLNIDHQEVYVALLDNEGDLQEVTGFHFERSGTRLVLTTTKEV